MAGVLSLLYWPLPWPSMVLRFMYKHGRRWARNSLTLLLWVCPLFVGFALLRKRSGRPDAIQGQQKTPVKSRQGIQGIPNVGNTCHMNAVIQVLCRTPYFRALLQKATEQKRDRKSLLPVPAAPLNWPLGLPMSILSKVQPWIPAPPKLLDRPLGLLRSIVFSTSQVPMTSQLDRSLLSLVEAVMSESPVTSTLAQAVLDEVSQIDDAFKGNRQQDSYHLFNTVVSGLEDLSVAESMYPVDKTISETETEKLMNASPISRLFGGVFCTIYTYDTCAHVELVFQRFTSIPVQIPPQSQICSTKAKLVWHENEPQSNDLVQDDKTGNQTNVIQQTEEDDNQANLIQQTEDTDNRANLVQQTEDTDNRANLIQQTEDTDNRANLVQQTEEDDNQTNVIQQTEEDDNQANLTQQTEDTDNQANLIQQTEDTDNRANLTQQTEDTDNQANMTQQTEDTDNQANLTQQTEDTDNQANLTQQTEDTDNQANLTQQTEDTDNQANLTQQTEDTDNQANLTQQTEDTDNRANLVQQTEDTDNRAYLTQQTEEDDNQANLTQQTVEADNQANMIQQTKEDDNQTNPLPQTKEDDNQTNPLPQTEGTANQPNLIQQTEKEDNQTILLEEAIHTNGITKPTPNEELSGKTTGFLRPDISNVMKKTDCCNSYVNVFDPSGGNMSFNALDDTSQSDGQVDMKTEDETYSNKQGDERCPNASNTGEKETSELPSSSCHKDDADNIHGDVSEVSQDIQYLTPANDNKTDPTTQQKLSASQNEKDDDLEVESSNIDDGISCDYPLNTKIPLHEKHHENVCCHRSLKAGTQVRTDLEEGLKLWTDVNESFGDLCCRPCRDCDGKKDSVTITRSRILFMALPPVLVLQFNRFKMNDGGNLEKIDRSLSYPEYLDAAPFCSSALACLNNKNGLDTAQEELYRLYGVVCHVGSIHGGHYTAHVRTPGHHEEEMKKKFLSQKWRDPESFVNEIKTFWQEIKIEIDAPTETNQFTQTDDTWYTINDVMVNECTHVTALHEPNAYLLMYERVYM